VHYVDPNVWIFNWGGSESKCDIRFYKDTPILYETSEEYVAFVLPLLFQDGSFRAKSDADKLRKDNTKLYACIRPRVATPNNAKLDFFSKPVKTDQIQKTVENALGANSGLLVSLNPGIQLFDPKHINAKLFTITDQLLDKRGNEFKDELERIPWGGKGAGFKGVDFKNVLVGKKEKKIKTLAYVVRRYAMFSLALRLRKEAMGRIKDENRMTGGEDSNNEETGNHVRNFPKKHDKDNLVKFLFTGTHLKGKTKEMAAFRTDAIANALDFGLLRWLQFKSLPDKVGKDVKTFIIMPQGYSGAGKDAKDTYGADKTGTFWEEVPEEGDWAGTIFIGIFPAADKKKACADLFSAVLADEGSGQA